MPATAEKDLKVFYILENASQNNALFFGNSRKEERYYKLFFSSKVSLHSFSCFEILVIRLLTFALFVYYCICGTVDT